MRGISLIQRLKQVRADEGKPVRVDEGYHAASDSKRSSLPVGPSGRSSATAASASASESIDHLSTVTPSGFPPLLSHDKLKNYKNDTLMFVEKHRPKTLDDIIGNENAIRVLRAAIAKRRVVSECLPPIILSGPPGIGKTTCMHAFARDILANLYRLNETVIEINGSDDRTEGLLRAKIGAFCERRLPLPDGMPGIIIVDEAESLDAAARNYLATLIKTTGSRRVWMLACNESKKIPSDIQSLAIMQRFSELSTEEMIVVLKKIANLEDVTCTPEAYIALTESGGGDLRSVIHSFQSLIVDKQTLPSEKRTTITKKDVEALMLNPTSFQIEQIIQYCIAEQLSNAIMVVMSLTNMVSRVSNHMYDQLIKTRREFMNKPKKMSILQEAAIALRKDGFSSLLHNMDKLSDKLSDNLSDKLSDKQSGKLSDKQSDTSYDKKETKLIEDTSDSSKVEPLPILEQSDDIADFPDSRACFSHTEIVNSLFQQITKSLKIPEALRIRLLKVVMQYQLNQSGLGETYLQLTACITAMCVQCKQFNNELRSSRKASQKKTIDEMDTRSDE